MSGSRPHWWPAYIGLGSNLADPVAQIDSAFIAIGNLPDTQLVLRSPLYKSSPIGPQDQPDYINAAATVLTQLSPIKLLGKLQAIEKSQGRTRGADRWGARTLDLDLLVFGAQVIESSELTVPHPRIGERNFVLLPLNDIAPDLQIPGGLSVARMAAEASLNEPNIVRLNP
ncbi:MAG: 2-amino-4-hydroxy-6-hydroxymethyldihydropteridine diphosphokinase [Woeseia sp.]|nr:2-amino-4-hydroxy-6-hydroxymethyldihydropteridine diphosphokinase [Woeseia sp.]